MSTRPWLEPLSGKVMLLPPATLSTAVLVRETPYGVVDGANVDFTTSTTFVSGSTVLYFNGLAQSVPDDYTEEWPNGIQMVTAPSAADHLLIHYVEA